MRNAAYISGSLHVVVVALAYFGLPALFDSDPAPNQPVYVEVVTLADQPVAKKSKPKPQPKPKPKPKAKLKPPPPPPLPPEVTPPKAEPVPVGKPKPKPKPKPKKIVPKKPKLAKLAPKPRRKPKPPKRADPLKSLLRDIQKQPKKDVVRKKPKTDKLKNMLASVAPPPSRKQSSISPIDRRREARALAQLVMRQVTPCWSLPAGAKDAHTIRVGVRIFLHPDGTLSGPPKVEDQARMSRDVAFRAVAESALRALRNPRCTPLRLPVKKYAAWREISFNFDPRELLR
ncbi:MAG: hypothetical protein VX741_08340 [Pseudomonadota bacterium]|nr:hypothetical protein [Pseudomonadota bacterium]